MLSVIFENLFAEFLLDLYNKYVRYFLFPVLHVKEKG